MNWLFVFLGGGLGSLARYGLALALPSANFAKGELPWFTLITNFLACLFLGGLLAYVSKDWLSRPGQLLLITGFCGGFSTFSTFAAEAWLLGEEGHLGMAALYVALSLLLGVGAIFGALTLVR
ncbi:MAG: CrcB family protein [Bacteroidota bacterium]